MFGLVYLFGRFCYVLFSGLGMFGFVYLFGRFVLVGEVWQVWFGRLGLVGLVW